MCKIVPLLMLFLVTGCDIFNGRICTDAGCQSNYEIVFDATDSLAIGDYEVTLAHADDQQLSCSFTLSQVGVTCLRDDCIKNRSCDQTEIEENFHFGISYSFYPDGEISLFFPPIEEELNITIRQNGERISNLVTQPLYERYYPNGPNCDPVCFTARDTITVDRE